MDNDWLNNDGIRLPRNQKCSFAVCIELLTWSGRDKLVVLGVHCYRILLDNGYQSQEEEDHERCHGGPGSREVSLR